MSVVGYVRVSTDEQSREGVSLAAQEERIRAYCVATGRTLDRIVVDAGISAKSLDRPALQAVLNGVRKRTIGTVIVLKLDRLTRSVRDLADLIDLFRDVDAALVSVSESLDTATASGRMVIGMLGVVAQWEREAIGERTEAALSHLRRNRLAYGHVPFGYRRTGNDLVPNGEEQDLILTARHMRERGTSFESIGRFMDATGLAPRRGARWHGSCVRAMLNSRMAQEAS